MILGGFLNTDGADNADLHRHSATESSSADTESLK